MKKTIHLLSIDQGTTSSRAIVFTPDGKVVAKAQKDLKLYYPHNGWVEQDPMDIWRDTLSVSRAVLKQTKKEIVIGITNQRETTIIWDRKSGRPIYNAIVWQDRRTADLCAQLKKKKLESVIAKKTGLLLDPYFSATKIAWILDHVRGARKRAERGELAFGTVDSWLLWNFTGGRVHATDATNASRTMLFNIVTQTWDSQLLNIFKIPRSLLPDVCDNSGFIGETEKNLLGKSYVVGGMAGDQQAALIGQACFEKGMVKSTYGTGCFALINIGNTFKVSKNRLLTTVAYRLDGRTTYAIEGSIFAAGVAVQWLRDGLKIFSKSADSEKMALSVPDAGGVYFVPAFTGLGAPYWQPEARGLITGLTRDSSAAHIARAALEAQAYQTLDLVEAMESDSGRKLSAIRADGGLVANGFMCQFLSDMLGRPVEVPVVHETTAWGAACLAGLYAGVFKDLHAVEKCRRNARRYAPCMARTQRDALYKGWKEAVRRALA